jgi:hypothetical protein
VSTERRNVEKAINILVENCDLLRLADFWRVFWHCMPAKRSWAVLSATFALLAAVGAAGWNASRYFQEPQVRPERVWLRGKVESSEGKPLEKFRIGLVELNGPFPNTDGTYRILAQRRQKYSVLIVPEQGFYPLLFFDGVPAKTSGGTFELDTFTGFPVNLGIVEGTVSSASSASFNGYVEVGGAYAKINQDGTFRVKNIPIGLTKIRIREKVGGPVKREEDVTVQVTGPTLKNVTVP